MTSEPTFVWSEESMDAKIIRRSKGKKAKKVAKERIYLCPGNGVPIRVIDAYRYVDGDGALIGYLWEIRPRNPSRMSIAIPAVCAVKEFRDQAWGLTNDRIRIRIVLPGEELELALSQLPRFTTSHIWRGDPDFVVMTRDLLIKPPPEHMRRHP